MSTVHILKHGTTYCGMTGLPVDWPKGHIWIAFNDLDVNVAANCPACLEARAAQEPLEAAGKSALCKACKREWFTDDGREFCSSCADAGWGVAYQRGRSDALATVDRIAIARIIAAADDMRHHLHTVGHEPHEPLADGEPHCALCRAALTYDAFKLVLLPP